MQITTEGVERMRKRAGVPMPRTAPYVEVATAAAIRRYVRGIGDLNPLFTDREHARRTRWGGLTAPPFFVETMGRSPHDEIPEEVKRPGRGALAGVHQFYAGNSLRRFLPVHEGDQLTLYTFITDVVEKHSELAGHTVHFKRRQVWENMRGQVVAVSDRTIVAGGRESRAGERRKHEGITPASYTPEQIAEIDEAYRRESEQFGVVRIWDDVNVGDVVAPIARGPLTVTDIVAYSMGRGSPFIKGAHGWAALDRMRHPNGYWTDSRGVPDITECVHWNEELAKKTGNPMPYDYGGQRTDWLASLLTNWAGDDAFVSEINVQLRGFNYLGDTTWCRGEITDKWVEGDVHGVSLTLSTVDQRGRTTSTGSAKILLPSRAGGPVRLRVVPVEEVAAEPARLAWEWAGTARATARLGGQEGVAA